VVGGKEKAEGGYECRGCIADAFSLHGVEDTVCFSLQSYRWVEKVWESVLGVVSVFIALMVWCSSGSGTA
jgi:hypothetical protein